MPVFLFCFVVFKGEGFFNSSLLKSPCYQENHTTVLTNRTKSDEGPATGF